MVFLLFMEKSKIGLFCSFIFNNDEMKSSKPFLAAFECTVDRKKSHEWKNYGKIHKIDYMLLANVIKAILNKCL